MTNKGTSTFIAQRASAVVLLPLAVWFLWSAAAHAGASYEEVRAWLSAPAGALPMGLLILVGALHMRFGLNEIIDDYVDSGTRGLFKLLNLFASLGAAALGVWALFSLSV